MSILSGTIATIQRPSKYEVWMRAWCAVATTDRFHGAAQEADKCVEEFEVRCEQWASAFQRGPKAK